MRSRTACCEHGISQQCRSERSCHISCHEIAVVLSLRVPLQELDDENRQAHNSSCSLPDWWDEVDMLALEVPH